MPMLCFAINVGKHIIIRDCQISTSTCKLELGFLVNGFNFWKNAIVKFDAHQATHYHKHTKTVLTALIVGENVMNRVDKHSSSQSVINTACLQKIFLTLRYLARQSLPIRGHTESEGNYIQIYTILISL